MVSSIINTYNQVSNSVKPKNNNLPNADLKEKELKNNKYDIVEISKEGLLQLKNQQESVIDSSNETTLENATESIEDAVSTYNLPNEEQEVSDTQESGEELNESSSVSGSIGINAGKLARKLASAKTREQVQAVIAEIRQDIEECEAGEEQGMIVDEASVQAAKTLLSQAGQRLSEVSNREATPEEEMAFLMAGLL